MNISKIFAKVVSYVFHPVWFPLLGVIVTFSLPTYIRFSYPAEYKWQLYLLLFFVTVLSPVITLFIFKRLAVVKDQHLQLARERIYPYLSTLIYYGFAVYLMKKIAAPPVIYYFLLGATLAVFLNFIINLKIKVSAHTTALGGFLAYLLMLALRWHLDLSFYIALTFVAFGVVSTARLLLKAHTLTEILLGFMVGFVSLLVVLNFT